MNRALFFSVTSLCGLSLGTAQTTQVADTKFLPRRGFFDTSFSLAITCETVGATIRFTTDGSAPSDTNGTDYIGPLTVGATTVVRAIATAPGLDSTNVDTHSYLFLADVATQPASIPGYAQNNYNLTSSSSSAVQMDYEMDPAITTAPAYSSDLIAGLKEIPSLCISVDPAKIFGSGGFYDGTNVEEVVSVETLYFGSPEDNEQAEAGIESHSHKRMKRSLRLNFRTEYGDSKWKTKLLRDTPFNASNRSTPNELDRVVLRAGNNRAWSRGYSHEKTTYAIDEFARQTQVAMGEDGMRGAFVHLYINGIYWGLFNPVHRADTFFTSETYGGDEVDWLAVSHGGVLKGAVTRYDYLKGMLKDKDMSVVANYDELAEHLDIDNFIDYLLLHWYTTTGDWPANNWYAGLRNPTSPDGATPMKFFAWDGEWSWDLPHGSVKNLVPAAAAPWVHIDFEENDVDSGDNGNNNAIRNLFNSAKKNPVFLRRLGDRAYRHLVNDGPLTDTSAQARFSTMTDYIENAVIAESARWGDTAVSSSFTRDVEWQTEVTAILGYMNGRASQLIDALRGEHYYPDFDPPTYNQHGGEVSSGFSLTLTNPSPTGDLYLSLDGSDPAEGGGALYNGAVTLTESALALARVKQGSDWSALAEATFLIPNPSDLHLTELHYHPNDLDGEEEFLELQNTGPVPLDISGFNFTTGITLTFPNPTILAPGETAVAVRNTTAFQLKYGAGARIIGDYSGKLSNDGEHLVLVTGLGQTVFDFTYNDIWHPATDGPGEALESGLQPPTNDPADWGPGDLPDGSPGVVVPSFSEWATAHGIPDIATNDSDYDGYAEFAEYVLGTNPSVFDPPECNMSLSSVHYRLRKNRSGLVVPQLSIDLENWPDQSPPVPTTEGVYDSYQLDYSSAERRFFRLKVNRD